MESKNGNGRAVRPCSPGGRNALMPLGAEQCGMAPPGAGQAERVKHRAADLGSRVEEGESRRKLYPG